jgi:hypothetical protein
MTSWLLEIAISSAESAALHHRLLRGQPMGLVESSAQADGSSGTAPIDEQVPAEDLWEILSSSIANRGGLLRGLFERPEDMTVAVPVDAPDAVDLDALQADICEALGVSPDKARWWRRTRAAAGRGSCCLRCGGVDGDHLKGCDAADT